MPPRKEKASGGNCQWSREDEATLVAVLKEHKAMGSWGDNNPKMSAWTASEQALSGSEIKSGGSHKTLTAIRNRWQRVCCLLLYVYALLMYNFGPFQLKKEYGIVKHLRSMSGWSWDIKTNLPKVEHDVWEAYIAVSTRLYSVPAQASNVQFLQDHPNAKPFRTKEFPLFEDIAELIDGTHATGDKAYRGGDSNTLAPAASSDSEDNATLSSYIQQRTQQSQPLHTQGSNITQSSYVQESRSVTFTQSGQSSIIRASSSINDSGTQSLTQSSNKGKERAEIETVDENIDPVSNLFIYSGISDNQNALQDLDLDPDVRPENLKRQRSKSSASTGYERRKARRNSSNQTDSAIGSSMEKALREVKESMLESAGRVGPSTGSSAQPEVTQPNGPNLAAIISAIEKNDDFSDNEKVDAYKVIKNDPRTGEMFATMTISRLQTKFLRDEINALRERKYGIGKE